MAAFSTLAIAATVASTAVSVAGQVSQAKAAKKAAQSQAAIDQANAELAEANAEAQALGIEKQTEFNQKEIETDKGILQSRQDRELAGMLKIGGFQEAQGKLDVSRLEGDAAYQAATAKRETASQSADLQSQIRGLVAKGDYEQAVIAARGKSGQADIIDEIGLLNADAGFSAGQKRAEAGETLRQAGAAITALNARNAYEQGTLDRAIGAEAADAANKTGALSMQSGEARAQVADASRALARNELASALEQQQLGRQRDRLLGAVRASAAKSGVAMDGSVTDMLIDQGMDATAEMTRAELAAAQRSDSLSAEMRGKSVQAELYDREAAGVTDQSNRKIAGYGAEKAYRAEDVARTTAETMAQAQFDAKQLTAQADHARAQADAKIATLRRHGQELAAETTRDAAYVKGEAQRETADARRKDLEVKDKGDAAQDYITSRLKIDRAGLAAEQEYAKWQLEEQVKDLKITTAEQTAALDREADMTKWRGETEAKNMRDFGSAQAQVLRQSAAATLSAGKSAYTTAMFGAGATLLRGGYSIANMVSPSTSVSWGDYGKPLGVKNSTGRMVGGV